MVDDDGHHARPQGATDRVEQRRRRRQAQRHPVTRRVPAGAQRAGDAGLRGVGLRTGDHLHHGDSGQCITEPPLTVSVAPLTKLAWRLARNTTAAATSSGWPIRRIGHAWIAASTNSGGLSTCCIGVSI